MEFKKVAGWATFLVLIFGAAWSAFQVDAKASKALEKGEKHELVFKNIEQIAGNLSSPILLLRNYLLLHQVDSTTAYTWSTYPQGAVKNKKGENLLNIPFLRKDRLPELGIYVILQQNTDSTYSVNIIDTLWNFKEKK